MGSRWSTRGRRTPPTRTRRASRAASARAASPRARSTRASTLRARTAPPPRARRRSTPRSALAPASPGRPSSPLPPGGREPPRGAMFGTQWPGTSELDVTQEIFQELMSILCQTLLLFYEYTTHTHIKSTMFKDNFFCPEKINVILQKKKKKKKKKS